MTLLNRKGQIFSTDLMIASIVFLFILTTAAVYGNQLANRLYFIEQDSEMRQIGQQAANILLLTTGSPANWQQLSSLEEVNVIGLAEHQNFLSIEKMTQMKTLTSSNYEDLKEVLGLSKFDFKLEVKSLQNNLIVESFGQEPGLESRVVSINRIAIYDSNNVVVRLRVFE